MSKKSTTLSPSKRPSTRSLSAPKGSEKDKYTFQSDDEDHHTKPILIRKSNTSSLSSKRPRGRPPKAATRTSTSSTSESEEKKPATPPTNIRDKIKINSTPPILITPKKRGRKPKMLSATPTTASTPDEPQKIETENLNPASPNKAPSNEPEEFSDDSVDFVWKGSSKMSIEILKRRIPKDESRDFSSLQSDPTAQRKRAIIPRLTNFENLSGQPVDNATSSHPNDDRAAKKASSVITLNNAFQNDFDYSYNDKGTKMSTATAATEEKPRPRVYAVKSTTAKARSQQDSSGDIKRPKWMNEQEEHDEDDQHVQASADEPSDYDYVPKGNYIPKRPNYRGRGSYPGRRGRPPGSRRHWNNEDDDDDDYDQYEETNARYGQRKSNNYRANRYDMADDDEYDKTRRMSLTQAYRRPNDIRQPTMNRRIGINNGNHPVYKDDDYYQQQQPSRPSATRLPTTNATPLNSGNTFVAKINDAQLSEVANQSQIFFVNMPQHDQKNQQVLSVLASEQQQVLPVAVVQQAKVEAPVSSAAANATAQNQTLAFTVKLPVDAPKQKKILPKPSANSSQSSANSNSASSKPFAWSRPPGRIQLNNDEQSTGKGLTITPLNTDLDTMEAAHVLATAADVTMANEARRKAQQNEEEMAMLVDETPSNVANEETVQCEDEGQKNGAQTMGTITANIIDENGLEHTVLLSTEEAQQLLGSQGAIIVDGDGQPISLQQAQTQTFLSPFALDQAQLQALLAQAGIDPNTPLTIEQIDPNQQQQQQVATLCTSPGGRQYTVLTQAPTQQQFILQTTAEPVVATTPLPIQPQLIAPKEDLSSPPKRRAFAVKSTLPTTEAYEDLNERPRRKIFATKSTVSSIE